MTSGYSYFVLWRAVGWLIVLAIAAFSLTPQQPNVGGLEINDKLGHSLAYAIGMGWFASLYPDRPRRVRYAVFLSRSASRWSSRRALRLIASSICSICLLTELASRLDTSSASLFCSRSTAQWLGYFSSRDNKPLTGRKVKVNFA